MALARTCVRKLPNLIRERKLLDTAPLYLRDGQPVPEGIAPERVIFVVRTFVEPPERADDELPPHRPLP
jgi:hypothetical protein